MKSLNLQKKYIIQGPSIEFNQTFAILNSVQPKEHGYDAGRGLRSCFLSGNKIIIIYMKISWKMTNYNFL